MFWAPQHCDSLFRQYRLPQETWPTAAFTGRTGYSKHSVLNLHDNTIGELLKTTFFLSLEQSISMYFSLASKTDSLLRLWLFIRKLDIGRNFFFSIDNNNMYRQHFGTTHFHLHMTFSHRWPYPFNSSKLSYLPKRLTDSWLTHFYSVVKKVHCSVTKRTYNISEFNSKISRLKEWLGPLRSLTHYTQEGLPVIIEQMKSFTEDILKLPRGLITVLRILRHLCIAPPNEYPEGKVDALQTCLIYRLRNKQL